MLRENSRRGESPPRELQAIEKFVTASRVGQRPYDDGGIAEIERRR